MVNVTSASSILYGSVFEDSSEVKIVLIQDVKIGVKLHDSISTVNSSYVDVFGVVEKDTVVENYLQTIERINQRKVT